MVVFDEFQEMASLDGVSLLKAMRSRMQAHKHVSYIFAGSKRHPLMSIFEEREGAVFKSAKPLELGPIPRADFERFLVDRFAAAGGRLDHEAAGAIVDASGGDSYYAQQIAHELFNISTRSRWPEDLESAVPLRWPTSRRSSTSLGFDQEQDPEATPPGGSPRRQDDIPVGVDREVRSHLRIPRTKSCQAAGRAGHHGRWRDRRPDVRPLAEGIDGAPVPASLTTTITGAFSATCILGQRRLARCRGLV